MKTKISFANMAAGILAACALTAACKSSTPGGYEQDTVRAKDGTKITLTFYNHASIAVQACGHKIYIDPADATKKIAYYKGGAVHLRGMAQSLRQIRDTHQYGRQGKMS